MNNEENQVSVYTPHGVVSEAVESTSDSSNYHPENYYG